MKPKTYFIRTMGCQMNTADSEYISLSLTKAGLKSTGDLDKANIAIVNTCTVRDHAEKRALSAIGNLKSWKKARKGRIIAVTGCAAERLGERLKNTHPYVDLVIGAKSVDNAPSIILKASGIRNKRLKPARLKSGKQAVSAFLNITRGCNNFCSYCVVPFVRGREVSRPPREIISEIRGMARAGTKEVTLLGQNVNSYKYAETDFAGLLYRIDAIPGITRVRFMTNHPKDMTDRIIQAVARTKKTCNHVHLPLQSGSDRILKLMNRKYTGSKYSGIIRRLRSAIPEVSITSDLMVGFPGETERDFKDTCSMVKRCGFDFCYVFKYSTREESAAARMKDTVSPELKSKRHARLLDICNETARKNNSRFSGRTVEVLAEGYSGGVMTGKTSDNRPVNFLSKRYFLGKIVPVLITGARIHSLTGKHAKTQK